MAFSITPAHSRIGPWWDNLPTDSPNPGDQDHLTALLSVELMYQVIDWESQTPGYLGFLRLRMISKAFNRAVFFYLKCQFEGLIQFPKGRLNLARRLEELNRDPLAPTKDSEEFLNNISQYRQLIRRLCGEYGVSLPSILPPPIRCLLEFQYFTDQVARRNLLSFTESLVPPEADTSNIDLDDPEYRLGLLEKNREEIFKLPLTVMTNPRLAPKEEATPLYLGGVSQFLEEMQFDLVEQLALRRLPEDPIPNIPPSLGTCHLPRLKHLELKIDLTSIPEEIFNLPNLQSLDVSHNQIQEIPDSIEGLTSLKALMISGNPMRKISRKITELKSLRILGMESSGPNCLVPFSFFHLPLSQIEAHQPFHLWVSHIQEQILNFSPHASMKKKILKMISGKKRLLLSPLAALYQSFFSTKTEEERKKLFANFSKEEQDLIHAELLKLGSEEIPFDNLFLLSNAVEEGILTKFHTFSESDQEKIYLNIYRLAYGRSTLNETVIQKCQRILSISDALIQIQERAYQKIHESPTLLSLPQILATHQEDLFEETDAYALLNDMKATLKSLLSEEKILSPVYDKVKEWHAGINSLFLATKKNKGISDEERPFFEQTRNTVLQQICNVEEGSLDHPIENLSEEKKKEIRNTLVIWKMGDSLYPLFPTIQEAMKPPSKWGKDNAFKNLARLCQAMALLEEERVS